MSELKTSAIILAAGTSSRMGRMKQLLPLGERPLLQHVIDKVLAENFSEVIAVIGHQSGQIKRTITIQDRRLRWAVNKDYMSGQGSSLKYAMQQVSEGHSCVMVFLGDLPFISPTTIQEVYHKGQLMLQECGEPFIVQPKYKGVSGHPVFFGHLNKELFNQLHGDQGGKAIMGQFSVRVRLPVEDAGILHDIDTPEAFEQAKQIYKNIRIIAY